MWAATGKGGGASSRPTGPETPGVKFAVARRILIVEDELLVALDAEATLQDAGHEVVGIAASAPQALALMESSEPDVVLLDIYLNGPQDGIEVAQQVRARSTAKIVFLTANADLLQMPRVRELGTFEVVSKPFEAEELLLAVQRAVNS